MQKYDYLNRLINTGCVAVVRGDDADEAVKTVDAVIAGGVTVLSLLSPSRMLTRHWMNSVKSMVTVKTS